MSTKKKPENDDLFDNGLDPIKRIIWLSGDITRHRITKTLKALSVLARMSSDQIILAINSEGGDMVQAFALIDAIRTCGCEVVGLVRGDAQSAAFVILQACHVRRAGMNAVLMTHAGNRTTEFDLKVDRRADQIVLDRLKEKDPNWTMHKLEKKQASDWYMFADEAINLGLLDEVY